MNEKIWEVNKKVILKKYEKWIRKEYEKLMRKYNYEGNIKKWVKKCDNEINMRS